MKKNMQRAAALRYFDNIPAPFLIAKGTGYMAEKMIEIAKREGINLIKDPRLSENLMEISIGDYIPEEMYEIVAEIFSFIWEIKNEK